MNVSLAILILFLAEIGAVFVLYFIFYKDVRGRIIDFLMESPDPADSASRLCGIGIIMMIIFPFAFCLLIDLAGFGLFGQAATMFLLKR